MLMVGRLLGVEPVSERHDTIASRGAEPSSRAGCAVPPLSVELQGEAGEAARAAADLSSGELRCQETMGEEMIASSSVEAPSAAGATADGADSVVAVGGVLAL